MAPQVVPKTPVTKALVRRTERPSLSREEMGAL